MAATIVDTQALWQTIVAAFVAGVGTTFIFSIAILAATRFSEATREGRSAEAAAFGVLAVVGLLATGAVIAFGVIVMSTK
jgi:ABC-type Fe3+ transport system permease subunit